MDNATYQTLINLLDSNDLRPATFMFLAMTRGLTIQQWIDGTKNLVALGVIRVTRSQGNIDSYYYPGKEESE